MAKKNHRTGQGLWDEMFINGNTFTISKTNGDFYIVANAVLVTTDESDNVVGKKYGVINYKATNNILNKSGDIFDDILTHDFTVEV
jgi:hypothetical protein